MWFECLTSMPMNTRDRTPACDSAKPNDRSSDSEVCVINNALTTIEMRTTASSITCHSPILCAGKARGRWHSLRTLTASTRISKMLLIMTRSGANGQAKVNRTTWENKTARKDIDACVCESAWYIPVYVVRGTNPSPRSHPRSCCMSPSETHSRLLQSHSRHSIASLIATASRRTEHRLPSHC